MSEWDAGVCSDDEAVWFNALQAAARELIHMCPDGRTVGTTYRGQRYVVVVRRGEAEGT